MLYTYIYNSWTACLRTLIHINKMLYYALYTPRMNDLFVIRRMLLLGVIVNYIVRRLYWILLPSLLKLRESSFCT